jgi:hypothetical protein
MNLPVYCLLVCSLFFRSGFVMEPVIKAGYDFFETDHLGNIYTVKKEELCKYLPDGKMHTRYSNMKLGSITSIDVSNPLKILLYYRDFQQIVFLDNQLSVNSDPVSLERLGYEQAGLVCISVNNSFWIYDRQNNELLRFDEKGRKVASTGNLSQVLQTRLAPDFMLEHNNYLFLNSPGHGIYVFDMFGAFSKIIPLKGLAHFQPKENVVYYMKDSALCSYNHRLFGEICRNIPVAVGTRSVRHNNSLIYIGYKDSILVKPLPDM